VRHGQGYDQWQSQMRASARAARGRHLAPWALIAVLLAACNGSSSATSPPTDGAADSSADAAGDVASSDLACWSMTSRAGCEACCSSRHPEAVKKFFSYNLVCACQASLCGPVGTADAASFGTTNDASDETGGPQTGDASAADSATTEGGDDAQSHEETSADSTAGEAGVGPFGQAICADTCLQHSPPTTQCQECATLTVQPVSGLIGPCTLSVGETCTRDVDCKAIVVCGTQCSTLPLP